MSQFCAGQRFTFDEVDAALCAWEDFDANTTERTVAQEDYRKHTRVAMGNWREHNGTCAAREACVRLGVWIDAVWRAAGGGEVLGIVFDWEFVPYLMDMVDWPDSGEWPRHPSTAFAAKVVRFRFGDGNLKG